MQAVFAGFGLGFSLILAIGAQNAFVLRQGILREHIVAVVAVCALSDAVLIIAGVAGFGVLVSHVPWLEMGMRLGGAAFLFFYGFRAFRAAWLGGQALQQGERSSQSLGAVVATCLLLTWANPHVYLDTVVLLGSISAQYDNRVGFGFGAAMSSLIFFCMLGFGARFLAPFFAEPRSWQVLDALVGLVMWAIAISLLV
ncbi:MAG: amino acid transporter [Thalassovita sp.]